MPLGLWGTNFSYESTKLKVSFLHAPKSKSSNCAVAPFSRQTRQRNCRMGTTTRTAQRGWFSARSLTMLSGQCSLLELLLLPTMPCRGAIPPKHRDARLADLLSRKGYGAVWEVSMPLTSQKLWIVNQSCVSHFNQLACSSANQAWGITIFHLRIRIRIIKRSKCHVFNTICSLFSIAQYTI